MGLEYPKLTRRAREVAELVALGLTNREIAKQLFRSERTIEWHVEQILNKLGFSSRTQIAAWIGRTQSAGEGPAVGVPLLGNLPSELTRFVGRTAELEVIRELVAANRLVTITGPGGAGKTRLALHLAADLQSSYPDGVWLCELASVSDPELVGAAVAAAVDAAKDALDKLAATREHLRQRTALLILDNCEHLVDVIAAHAELLARECPHIKVLTTSREALGIEGEYVYRMGPMILSDAVELFRDRAKRADTGFELSRANSEAVESICQHLDALPLAIELAAGCIPAMTLDRILERLDARLTLLTGSRANLQRHRTLRSALEWSEALLTEPERRLFRRLSVFIGGFDLDAAEAVTSLDDLPVSDVLPLLRRLVDRSLVALSMTDSRERYLLLETVRLFARDQLNDREEAPQIRQAHARYYTRLACAEFDAARRIGASASQSTGIELGNQQAALDFFARINSDEAFAELAGAATGLWDRRKPKDAAKWLALAGQSLPNDNLVRRRYHLAVGRNAVRQGDLEVARQAYAAGLATCDNNTQPGERVLVLTQLFPLEQRLGDRESALQHARQATELARATNQPEALASALNNLGMTLIRLGEPKKAVVAAREALELSKRHDVGGMRLASALDTLALTHLYTGQPDKGIAIQKQSLEINLEDDWLTLQHLLTMASLLSGTGHYLMALMLYGAVEANEKRLAIDLDPVWRLSQPWIELAKTAVGEDASSDLLARGATLMITAAKAEALRVGDETAPPGKALTTST